MPFFMFRPREKKWGREINIGMYISNVSPGPEKCRDAEKIEKIKFGHLWMKIGQVAVF